MVSFIAVLGLLCVIAVRSMFTDARAYNEPILTYCKISAFNTRKLVDRHLFVRTHIATYFLCLLVCDCLQGLSERFNFVVHF